MNAELIAKQARKSLSSYCVEECRAYCCRKGYLVLNLKECELITGGRIKELSELGVLKPLEFGQWSLHLGNSNYPCPCLKDFMCTIHKRKYRPLACKEFPLFLEGKTIRLSQRCPAVRAGKLYPFVHKLLRLGYTLQKRPESSAYDYGNMFTFCKNADAAD